MLAGIINSYQNLENAKSDFNVLRTYMLTNKHNNVVTISQRTNCKMS